MENCLASTGINWYTVIVLGIAVISAGVVTLYFSRPKNMTFSVLALVFVVGLAVTPTAFAAEGTVSCTGASTPDVTQGATGQVQSINVTLNDSPTPGYTFVLSSLTLSLRPGHVLGSTVSGDGKTVTAPGEGTYVAQTNGSIVFTPAPGFTGTAVGVNYSMLDTAGVMATSTYTPTVTGPASACTDPASESRILATPHVLPSSGDYGLTFLILSFAQNSGNTPAILPASVDIYPTLPGVQTTFSTANRSIVYDTINDTVTVTVLDDPAFLASVAANQPLFSYTIEALAGCQQPAGKDVMIDALLYTNT